MTTHSHARHDPRPTAELVKVALNDVDENVAWDAICALQWRGSRDVLDAARALCQQATARERELGCNILG